MKDSGILYESGDYWITAAAYGFDVYKVCGTHSQRCARIGFTGAAGMQRARAEIERRQALAR